MNTNKVETCVDMSGSSPFIRIDAFVEDSATLATCDIHVSTHGGSGDSKHTTLQMVYRPSGMTYLENLPNPIEICVEGSLEAGFVAETLKLASEAIHRAIKMEGSSDIWSGEEQSIFENRNKEKP